MSKKERIVDALSRGSCLTTRQITDRVGGSMGGTMSALQALEKDGKVCRWHPSPREKYWLWALEDPKFPTIKEK